jgi:hypothetical protein
MTDEPDPPRKFYKLGEAKFQRVNEAAPPPIEGAISGAAGNAPPAPPPLPNDVHRILLENRAIDHEAGLYDLAPKPKRKSRRKRDYWILMFLFNGLCGLAIAHFGLLTIPGMYAFAGMIMVSAGLTWVMWFIMDDYHY